jgi:hypothetical protein
MKKAIFNKVCESGFPFVSYSNEIARRACKAAKIDISKVVCGMNGWKDYARISDFVNEEIVKRGKCEVYVAFENGDSCICKFSNGNFGVLNLNSRGFTVRGNVTSKDPYRRRENFYFQDEIFIPELFEI